MDTNSHLYLSHASKNRSQAIEYCKTHQCAYRYLAYRDIPAILEKYIDGKKALDYGTGTGCSAHFIEELGFDVTGVDVSEEMLHQTQLSYPTLPLFKIENEIIPLQPSSYDLVFSSFVLFELGSQKGIVNYLREARRVLKRNGLFVAITGSENLYSLGKSWLSFSNNFPQNNNPKSGNLVKLYLHDAEIEFTDYYWTERDYRHAFSEAGFNLIEILYPLGISSEPYIWKDELFASPFIILVAKIS